MTGGILLEPIRPYQTTVASKSLKPDSSMVGRVGVTFGALQAGLRQRNRFATLAA